MRVINEPRYEAEDGKTFKSKEACERYEALGMARAKYQPEVDDFIAHLEETGGLAKVGGDEDASAKGRKMAEGRIRNVISRYLAFLDGQSGQ